MTSTTPTEHLPHLYGLVSLGANKADLDVALEAIFIRIDPMNRHNLGEHAGEWFTGDEDCADEWPTMSLSDRRRRLSEFFVFISDNIHDLVC